MSAAVPILEFSGMAGRVMVTGGAGFIGSNLANYLARQNYFVLVLDILDYCGDIENLEDFPNIKFVQGDIADINFVRFLLETYDIQIVLHLAAQTHVDNSFGNSLGFTETNVLGTHRLLETVRRYGKISLFLHMSTDEVYGEIDFDEARGYTEDRLLNPTNPYAASKAAAEQLVRSYHISHNLPIIITRANNNYGPRQFPEKLIPKFIMKFLGNETVPIHGNGQTRRNFIHVYDTCRALETVMTRGEIGMTYNIGTNCEYSVLEIAEILRQKIQPCLDEPLIFVADRNFNDRRYHINDDLLRSLGWSETVSFEEGLEETIEWYRSRYHSYHSVMQEHVK